MIFFILFHVFSKKKSVPVVNIDHIFFLNSHPKTEYKDILCAFALFSFVITEHCKFQSTLSMSYSLYVFLEWKQI